MVEVNQRPIPKVPALRGKTVVSLFFEDSTRTRTSFDTAARAAERRRDELRRVVEQRQQGREPARHDRDDQRRWASTRSSSATGRAARRSRSRGGPNASDHQRRRRLAPAPDAGAARLLHDPHRASTGRDGFDGLRIAIVGDIKHSRVARSDVQAFTALGARVTLVAPPTLLPPSLDGWPVDVSHDLDA